MSPRIASDDEAARILKDLEVARFLIDHRDVLPRVRRAAKLLARESDALEAVKKVLPALESNTIKVFLSYKKIDEEAAKKIVALLRDDPEIWNCTEEEEDCPAAIAGYPTVAEKCRGMKGNCPRKKLAIAYMAEFTSRIAGRAYRPHIVNELKSANWLILLFPDPSDDWDWCLFETGIFEGLSTSADRIICLHHADAKIPDQLGDYQAVSARSDELVEFLDMVYRLGDPVPGMKAIKPLITNEKIQTIADQIEAAVRPPIKRQELGPYIKLKIASSESLTDMETFNKTKISFCNDNALHEFSLLETPQFLGSLRSDQNDKNYHWREELLDKVRQISQNDIPYPNIQNVFKTKKGKLFRPVVFICDYFKPPPSGQDTRTYPFEVYVGFTEEVRAIDRSSMPDDVSRLSILLRFALRFRYEVLEEFTKKGISDKDEVERLNYTLHRMRLEFAATDKEMSVSRNMIINLFPNDTERVGKLFADYDKITNRTGTGKLDVAIKEMDCEKISSILNEIIPMSNDFLEKFAARFAELTASTGRVPA